MRFSPYCFFYEFLPQFRPPLQNPSQIVQDRLFFEFYLFEVLCKKPHVGMPHQLGHHMNILAPVDQFHPKGTLCCFIACRPALPKTSLTDQTHWSSFSRRSVKLTSPSSSSPPRPTKSSARNTFIAGVVGLG